MSAPLIKTLFVAAKPQDWQSCCQKEPAKDASPEKKEVELFQRVIKQLWLKSKL